MKIELNGRKLIIFLVTIYGVLLVGHMLALTCLHGLGRHYAFGIVPTFHFDREANLPTLFSGVMLTLAGFLAFLIGRKLSSIGGKPYRPWYLIAAILWFLAVDEMAHLHENLDLIISWRYKTTGVLHWPWVGPYAIIFLVVVGILLRFFLQLPRATQGFLASFATIYVCGAIGMEMLAANHAEDNGEETLTYLLLMTIEESLEMIAVMVLITGLLNHARRFASCLEASFSIKPAIEN